MTFKLTSAAAVAADYPRPEEGDWVARDFRFHNGEVMPELRLHYTTVGEPAGEPVLIMHGTGSAGTNLLNAAFAGELFGAGQPLDATRYFIILPDAIGHGKSSRPSDGLRTKFPRYDYDDMVDAHHRLIREGLGIAHLRLAMGNSMGGMHAWVWGVRYPAFMDALVPMAAQPVEMAGRNWMLRRLMIEIVRNDPGYNGGDYTTQPTSMKYANAFYGVATSGGTRGYQALAGTHAQADKLVDDRLAAPFDVDANNFIYAWESSANYNPSLNLEKIEAPLMAINTDDDERNPPETGVMERAMKRVKNGRLLLVPASEQTRGHGTTGMAALWKRQFAEFLSKVPRRTM